MKNLFWVAIGGLFFFFSLGSIFFFVFPEYAWLWQTSMGISFFSFILGLFFSRQYIVQLTKSTKGRLYIGHIFNFMIITFILGLLNYFVFKHDYFIDLTLNKLHTLSDQSKKIVKEIENKEIELELYASRKEWGQYRRLLDLFKREGDNFQVKFIDLDRELGLVALHSIKENGTLLLRYKGKEWKTVAKSELAVTSLLYKVFSPKKRKLYFSVGHNEMVIKDTSNVGGSYLTEKMIDEGWEVKTVELQYEVPKDANGLFIINPQIDFLEIEIKNLQKFIASGGNLFIALSPRFNEVGFEKFDAFLKSLGIEFVNLIVLDRLAAQQGSQPSIPVISRLEKHEITKGFNGRLLFPISATFRLENDAYTFSTLAKSIPFPGSWGELSFNEVKNGEAHFDEGKDLKGNLPLFVIGENENKARIIAISSSAFFSNQFKSQSDNYNFLLSSISWLIRDETKISLTRPNVDGNIIFISDMQANMIFYITIIFMPFIFFGIGIYFFRKRISR